MNRKIIAHGLAPLSWLFGGIVAFRNLLYDRKVLRAYHCPVPVISVGNIVAGGTGKTPFVEYLMRYFRRRGIRAAVLSRGYKRSTRGMIVVSDGTAIAGDAVSVGDEPFQIASKFPEMIVAVDERRARAAKSVAETFKPGVIVLDDGFQHRALYRDLDIVMLGDIAGTAGDPLLPAGRRREHLSSLERADILALTGDEQSIPEEMRYPGAPLLRVSLAAVTVRTIGSDDRLEAGTLAGCDCLAFCGLGNPEAFRRTLEQAGIRVRRFVAYPDHYLYRQEDLRFLYSTAAQLGVSFLITTEKDAVRLRARQLGTGASSPVLHYLEVETRVMAGEEALHAALERVLAGTKP